ANGMFSSSPSISALRRFCSFMFYRIPKNMAFVNGVLKVFAEKSRCTLIFAGILEKEEKG
ncbi:MAG: hypothetical protein J6Z49_10165, partial [Kiritimatiellae bacterium]|nr:hypothetical protein [Kiritimatiellia bacterium]